MKSTYFRTASFCFCVVLFLMPTPSSAVDRDPTEAFQVLADVGATYINNSAQCPGALSAMALNDNLQFYTVIDVRSEPSYLSGHIPGAWHSSYNTLIDDLENTIPTDKPYVIAGYTGQSSSMLKMAMELLGYEDVKSLLFGMSAWNSELDHWTNNCADNLWNPETENQNDQLTVHEFPQLGGAPETIVRQRVEAMLEGGYRGTTYNNIVDYLDNYFIINYFGEADYLGIGSAGAPGHIPGAFQFTPYSSMGIDQMLSNIPTDMPVVVYAWTGQHSAQIVAYLNLLGYEAYNLNFGANALFYSDLFTHKWSAASMNDFALETGSNLSAAPDALPLPVTGLSNYPNPFNPTTTISYRLHKPVKTDLRIYDVAGHLVRTLVHSEDQSAGFYEFNWKGKNDQGMAVPSGTYLYRLDAGPSTESRRLMLLK